MTPLDSRNLQRLAMTLADIERAIDVSRVHVASGCPDAEFRQLLVEIPDNLPTDRCPRNPSTRGAMPTAATTDMASGDPEEAFRTAILAGVLSTDLSAPNWAGHYMYMFHDEDGTPRFKHRDTRTYLSMTALQRTKTQPP